MPTFTPAAAADRGATSYTRAPESLSGSCGAPDESLVSGGVDKRYIYHGALNPETSVDSEKTRYGNPQQAFVGLPLNRQ